MKPIKSDDPKAIELLEKKLVALEGAQDWMKKANAFIRKDDLAGFLKMNGATPQRWDELTKPDYVGRKGFRSFEITNNGSEIRRIKQRLEELKSHAEDVTTEKEVNGIRILDNVEDARLQIFFEGKPAENIRAELKSYGFKWSPTNGAWQRMRSSTANYHAERIAKMA